MTDESSTVPPPPAVSYAGRLWRRYRKARGAQLGLALVGAFTLVAFLAPFLAHRLPFFWRDAATGEWSWPLIREFFSPSDTTEPMLEKGINFLFVFIPAALAAWLLMGKYRPGLSRISSPLISLLFGALFSAAIWYSVGGMVLQGAGKDWFYSEAAPVPEIDDMESTKPFWGQVLRHMDSHAIPFNEDNFSKGERESLRSFGPDSQQANAAWTLLKPSLEKTLADTERMPRHDTDEGRRWLMERLQLLVDGPALATAAEVSGAGIDVHDVADANLDQRINQARLNRFLIESAFPGLLVPMRQFRSPFLILAGATLLTLLGLTYIFLAGAYQFSLSPRWLVLLALALLVALPFGAAPRHDHTPYRELAAKGKGTGLFPLIPYGPNEQGFGPRLPPSWFAQSPLLTPEGVRSWEMLKNALSTPRTDLERLAASELSSLDADWPALVETESGRETVLALLNQLIAGPSLYNAEATSGLKGDLSLRPYFSEMRSGRDLAPEHLARMNRLLLEKAAPGAFIPASAVRWKKPRHTPGLHLLGTDESGRDVLVRVIHGARVSLSVGFISVFLATVIGLVMGSLAAYYGGRVDMLISRFIEIMMCFPSFFLILAVIAVLDKRSIINIMLVIGITSWTGVARLIRGEMLRQKKMDYVSASIALGASDTRTIFRQILPNAMAPVLVSISFGITGAILTEASLSFIGFGVTPPTPTWGQLLSETRDSPLANWWLAVFPGIVLFISVIAYNMVGEAIRDTLDPRTNL